MAKITARASLTVQVCLVIALDHKSNEPTKGNGQFLGTQVYGIITVRYGAKYFAMPRMLLV